MFKRYAIYYTPPPGDFARRGAVWLGWDVQAGEAVAHPDIEGLDIAKLTQRPRKYGLHGTVKAPF
ncbi:MAG TPA: phosphonate metabolism protein, partial [Sulfitobacter pontiacus]|nr:phosphonate metabolism protein [Sulfitobacter pontiacus]